MPELARLDRTPVAARLRAMRQVALADDRVGLTIVRIMPLEGWREAYSALVRDTAAEANGIANLDLTVELTAHCFTLGSKSVLNGWYPSFILEMDEARQARRTTRFNSVKYVYTASIMQEMCTFFEGAIKDFLPPARILYWT